MKSKTLWVPLGWIVGIGGIVLGQALGQWTGDRSFELAITFTLVWVTALYVLETAGIRKSSEESAGAAREQAKATIEMVMATKEQQHNIVAPVIELSTGLYSDEGTVEVWLRNIGVGPALNLRCWIDDPEHPELRKKEKALFQGGLGVGSTYPSTKIGPITWSPAIRTGLKGYKLIQSQGRLRAQYEDVFGMTYESSFIVSTNALPELKYGVATEKIIL